MSFLLSPYSLLYGDNDKMKMKLHSTESLILSLVVSNKFSWVQFPLTQKNTKKLWCE